MDTEYREKTLDALAGVGDRVGKIKALVGFDGFVDVLVTAVDKRFGPGEDFVPIPTIGALGERISAAAGKSTNIEYYPRGEKLGGNGPIMANALIKAGLDVSYIGALGVPGVHQVFADMEGQAEVVSLCDPGVTYAWEFDDGKIMFNTTTPLEGVSYEQILSKLGQEALRTTLAECGLIGMVNWTMIPNMSSLFRSLLEKELPALEATDPPRNFFFDLADPAKRSDEDLREVLELISQFGRHGNVTLGLNYKEAQRVGELLGMTEHGEDRERLLCLTKFIRDEVDVETVVVHPVSCAACATPDGTYFTDGPVSRKPKITTGAGDHFNAGYTTAQQLGFDPGCCLTVATFLAGYYVCHAQSPSLDEVREFLTGWQSND